MAPEQEKGGVVEVTTSADIYALGKLFHWMLTGRTLAREHLDDAFTPNEFAKDRRYRTILEQILARTIVFNPVDRIQSCEELLDELNAIRQA
jgi:serine/threonine protein kinase